ncbi:hypothetical protein LENED_000369 [Lentinula edodes]|uniref:Uncharacterized protein n=1 Tax=Lentinula edodes TaxID=5353 RepID=A0A1Q3DVC2_LENED|nr:hypothetical protein LENED_000369 [Lentinula edodes]
MPTRKQQETRHLPGHGENPHSRFRGFGVSEFPLHPPPIIPRMAHSLQEVYNPAGYSIISCIFIDLHITDLSLPSEPGIYFFIWTNFIINESLVHLSSSW